MTLKNKNTRISAVFILNPYFRQTFDSERSCYGAFNCVFFNVVIQSVVIEISGGGGESAPVQVNVILGAARDRVKRVIDIIHISQIVKRHLS